MLLRVQYTFFIFVLIAGIILPSNTSSKIAIAAGPESQDRAHTHNAPAVDLSKKSVLVLHTFQANMPLNIKADHGIRATLEAAGMGVKQQYFEYLDLARNLGPEHKQQLAEMLRLRFARRKIDLVITLELGALQFVLNEGQALFPNAPVLALDLPPTFELPQTERRIIQQSIKYNMIGTLQEALKLVPKAKRVYVVAGTYPEHKPYLDQARLDFRKWEDHLEFIYLNDRSFEEMLTMSSSAPSGTIVLYVALVTDITGKIYNPRDTQSNY